MEILEVINVGGFENTTISSPAGAKRLAQDKVYNDYKDKAGNLMSEYWKANESRKKAIKKELSSIPMTYNGKVVYQTLGAF